MQSKVFDQGFECTKTRNTAPIHFESAIDWDTLKINPTVNYYGQDEVPTNLVSLTKTKAKVFEKSSDDL